MGGVKLLQIILIVFLGGGLFYLIRLYNALRLEKRIAPFAIASIVDSETSLIDNVCNLIFKVIHKYSWLLKKSQVLSRYGEKYNKFISFEEKDVLDGLDYVSMKILLGLLVLALSLVTLIFHKIEFNILFFLGIFIISFFIPDIFLNIDYFTKRKKVNSDLLKAIIIMNNAFKSGKNIMQAIELVNKELDGPIKDEFKKISLDINYGLSLDIVFERFYERVKLEDAKYIASSLTLLNKTGGDIIKVFSMIEKSIIDKKNLKNELDSLTSSSRFVFKMLVCLPIIFSLLISILNPTYFRPLFNNPIGLIIFCLIILIYVLYILVIRKVLKVKI